MPDTKLSALTAVSNPVVGTDTIYLVRAGASYKTTVADLPTGTSALFSAGVDGLVAGPVASTGKFLRDDNSFQTIGGGGDLLAANNLSDVANVATARSNLGLAIGTNVQAYDADLTTWAGVTPGTGIATALAIAVGSAGAPVINGGALGTPSSGVATNLTGTASGLTAGTVTTNANLSGDVTSSGSNATTIANSAVTLAKMANMATSSLIYRRTAGTGAPEVNTVAQLKTDLAITFADIGAGVMVANQTFGENTELILDAALSADGKYCGITETGTLGETVAFGEVCYFKAADSKWWLTDADADATAGDVDIAMCVVGGAANATGTLLRWGKVRADAKFPTLTIGASVYVSTTPGAVQTAQPSGTDDVIRKVGFARTADEIFFNPSTDYMTHT